MTGLEPFAVAIVIVVMFSLMIWGWIESRHDDHSPLPVKAKDEGPLIIRPHRGGR